MHSAWLFLALLNAAASISGADKSPRFAIFQLIIAWMCIRLYESSERR